MWVTEMENAFLCTCPYSTFLCLPSLACFPCCRCLGCRLLGVKKTVWSIITKTIWFSCTLTHTSSRRQAARQAFVCFFRLPHFSQQKACTPAQCQVVVYPCEKPESCMAFEWRKTVVCRCRNTTQVRLYTMNFYYILREKNHRFSCACAVSILFLLLCFHCR